MPAIAPAETTKKADPKRLRVTDAAVKRLKAPTDASPATALGSLDSDHGSTRKAWNTSCVSDPSRTVLRITDKKATSPCASL
jgi:hypothetical protein